MANYLLTPDGYVAIGSEPVLFVGGYVLAVEEEVVPPVEPPAEESAILGGGGGGVRKVKSKRKKDPYQWVREDLVKAFTALEAEPEPPRVVVEIKREYAEPTSYKPVIDYAALQADVALAQRLIAAYQALIEKRVMDEIIERDDEEVLMLFMSTRRLAVH